MIVAMITSMSPQTLFAPFLKEREVLPEYPPDLHGFVAIDVEKWLTKQFGCLGMPDKWVTELVLFLRCWFCKH